MQQKGNKCLQLVLYAHKLRFVEKTANKTDSNNSAVTMTTPLSNLLRFTAKINT